MPDHPSYDAEGNIVFTYLRCDAKQGSCVKAIPEDYLGRCYSHIENYPSVEPTSYADNTDCVGGVCLMGKQGISSVRVGCSMSCAQDSDCPEGSICSSFGARPGCFREQHPGSYPPMLTGGSGAPAQEEVRFCVPRRDDDPDDGGV
jgi:hypothetical protein